MFAAVRRGDPQAERRFFFFWVLPFQSVLLTAFVAPMYGFNALIQPLNQTPRVYLIVLHLLFAVFISMGALAIWLDWYWLVLVGFTLP